MDRPPELATIEAERLPQQKMSIPRLRRPPAMPRGPKNVGVTERAQVIAGPGEPPEGFISSANSKTEWYIYWALSKIFSNPTDFRRAPFNGGYPDWVYQQAVNGGIGILGGTAIDFVVYTSRKPTALRIVTEYYHLFTSRTKQVTDEWQKINLSDQYDVVDIYDMDFINDTSGEQTIQVVKMALAMIERPNPILAGVALRGSRMDKIAG